MAEMEKSSEPFKPDTDHTGVGRICLYGFMLYARSPFFIRGTFVLRIFLRRNRLTQIRYIALYQVILSN